MMMFLEVVPADAVSALDVPAAIGALLLLEFWHIKERQASREADLEVTRYNAALLEAWRTEKEIAARLLRERAG